MLDEDEGCAVLLRVFVERGYRPVRDVRFAEGDVTFDIDGWDAEARVGFEYMTRHAGDHDDLTQEELGVLEARMRRGELFVFIVDETDIADAGELEWAAHRFLDEVQRRRATPEVSS